VVRVVGRPDQQDLEIRRMTVNFPAPPV